MKDDLGQQAYEARLKVKSRRTARSRSSLKALFIDKPKELSKGAARPHRSQCARFKPKKMPTWVGYRKSDQLKLGVA
jgi:hypothetical protein